MIGRVLTGGRSVFGGVFGCEGGPTVAPDGRRVPRLRWGGATRRNGCRLSSTQYRNRMPERPGARLPRGVPSRNGGGRSAGRPDAHPVAGNVERGSMSHADGAAELGAEAQERVNFSHSSGKAKSGRGRVTVAFFLWCERAEPVVERGTDVGAVLADDVEKGVPYRGTVPGAEGQDQIGQRRARGHLAEPRAPSWGRQHARFSGELNRHHSKINGHPAYVTTRSSVGWGTGVAL